MTEHARATGSGIPILGGLSGLGRIAFLVVVGLARP